MRKNHVRDYATDAFRFYAANGPSEAYIEKIKNEAIEAQHRAEGRSGISNPTEAAVRRGQEAIDAAAAEINDLIAVEQTITLIESMKSGNDIMKALRMIYMAEPEKDLEKGEITERVHHAEIFIPASERSIYGWLSMARSIFAKARGLRL